MSKTKTTDVLTSVVNLLEPIESEDRIRIINAALALLGESTTPSKGLTAIADAGLGEFPPRARAWMNQYGLSSDEMERVFNVVDGIAEVISPHMPGENKKEQTLNAYVLTGIARLIATDNTNFSDSEARNLCIRSGCYDSGNHATTMKNKGNQFSGTKDKGWTLTAPGLKHAAEIIKELSK